MSAALSAVWIQSCMCTEGLWRIVTLSCHCDSVHRSVGSLCGWFWYFKTLHGGRGGFRLCLRTIEHAQSHTDSTCAVMPCSAFVCVCGRVCTRECADCVQVCFLGVLVHVGAGWVMGIPCLHSPVQHAGDCSVGWMPSRLHIKKPSAYSIWSSSEPASRSLLLF